MLNTPRLPIQVKRASFTYPRFVLAPSCMWVAPDVTGNRQLEHIRHTHGSEPLVHAL